MFSSHHFEKHVVKYELFMGQIPKSHLIVFNFLIECNGHSCTKYTERSISLTDLHPPQSALYTTSTRDAQLMQLTCPFTARDTRVTISRVPVFKTYRGCVLYILLCYRLLVLR